MPTYRRCADCPNLVPEGAGARCPRCAGEQQARRQARPIQQVYTDPRWPHVRHDVAERAHLRCRYCPGHAPFRSRDAGRVGVAAHIVRTQHLLEQHGLDACFDLRLIVWAHRACAEANAPRAQTDAELRATVARLTGGESKGAFDASAATRRRFSVQSFSVDSAPGGVA